ncbi:hypothetical protein DY218_26430 [Streptomyces triticagri]|uniref:Uncharacterized protein n=1 Tax=Streptomyces triticagri TaxID=2293568 RepID=A0A372LZJ7_9ACTN|nr:hypothetical protein [Streptomyces triticagri]RFU83695.1 hypothetical protein DY218_26430 [Streptomyces triticagri]
MKFKKTVARGTAMALLATGGVAAGTATATAGGEPVEAKGSWKRACATREHPNDKDGLSLFASRYWSGDSSTNANAHFQSYGEVWEAENRTTAKVTVRGYVSGKLEFKAVLKKKGDKARKNDSFTEGKKVKLHVTVHGGRGTSKCSGGVT